MLHFDEIPIASSLIETFLPDLKILAPPLMETPEERRHASAYNDRVRQAANAALTKAGVERITLSKEQANALQKRGKKVDGLTCWKCAGKFFLCRPVRWGHNGGPLAISLFLIPEACGPVIRRLAGIRSDFNE